MTDHVREHRSVLATLEKRLLIWLAVRLPRQVHSDHLTALALAAMFLAGAGYALARWDVRAVWVVAIALGLNWFGDSLDGTLARVRRAERPKFGFYVDHVVDLVGTAALMAGLACSSYMTPAIALMVLAAYLLVSAEVFLAHAVHGVFRLSFAGVGPTELRLLLVAGTLVLPGDPHLSLGAIGAVRLFDAGGVVAAAGLCAALLVSALRNGAALARIEPRVRQP